ncbi:MAG: hypothetical protein WA700_07355 [Acidobacteriaceae bacterium]
MKFAKIVFWCAGVGGIAALTPAYFLLNFLSARVPPPFTHPVFYYGFLAVVQVWHAAFCWIGTDPVRFRPMMPFAVMEKFVFVFVVIVVWLGGQAISALLLVASADFLLGVLFLAAFLETPVSLVRPESVPC